MVQCTSKLRSIGQACFAHAAAHDGHLPLAGRVVVAPTTHPLNFPLGLNDGERLRYRYVYAPDSPIQTTPLPFVAALAPHLGVNNLPTATWAVMDQALNAKEGAWLHFMCPETNSIDKARATMNANDATVEGQATMLICQIGSQPVTAWATNSDYVINEGLFGYHYDVRFSRNRLGGKMSAVKRPDQLVMFTDGVVRNTAADSMIAMGWMTWTPSLDGPGAATLADALANSARAGSAENFDPGRHNGKLNALFADGHVETLKVEADALRQAYLVAP